MAKRNPKPRVLKTIEMLMEAKFLDYACIAVRFQHPWISPARMQSMGEKLIELAKALKHKEHLQESEEALNKEINILMYGDTS